jgi:hypothetical protein
MLPGKGPAGSDSAVIAALLAMLAGAGLSAALAFSSGAAGVLAAALAPASAVFMTARFYTYDPYYAPTLRRMSDGGVISETWTFGLLLAALLAGLCTRLWPPLGHAVTVPLILLCAFTTVFQGTGH